MKYVHKFFLSFIILNEINCHTINRTKYVEQSDIVTTLLPINNTTQDIKSKNLSERNNEPPNTERDDENIMYLHDVLFSLQSQNWTAEQEPCLNRIYHMLYGLQNFTLWAVWEWDAQASTPQGVLFGNRYQLGNFDQCMNAPWSKTQPELKTKYCLAEIVLERTEKVVKRRADQHYYPYRSAFEFIEHRPAHTRPLNELTWGACVPDVCAPQTVERLLGILLSRSHFGTAEVRANISIEEPCQSTHAERKYDALFYTFFGIMGFLLAIALICTYLNQTKKLESDSKKTDIIKSFCLKENTLDILTMRKEGTEVFYGIRFITMCFIVLDHQIAFSIEGPSSDGLTTDQTIQSALGLFILHDDLFVDTYFLLSGFFTIASLSRVKRLPNPLIIILKRYVRLVVAYAVVIFYLSAVFPHSGSGPLWNQAIARNTVQCRQNWWLNLLMLSNYIDPENACIVVSWYIPCDFHFFVVTLLVYCLYKSMPRVGLTVAGMLTAVAIILPGVVTYIYQMSPVQLFTYETSKNPRANKDFNEMYIKSHYRYAAYLVGVYGGYLFVKYSKNGYMNRMRQKWSVLGTCAALTLMLVIMVTGSLFLWHSYYPLEAAVYAALNRPAWACCIAIIAMCCAFGHVPLVKSFLSWYPWVPLSRLSYGLYLTHTIIITRNVYVSRNPQDNDYFKILNASAGVIVWGCVAALLIWLLTEAPANKLLATCFKSMLKKLKETEELNQDIVGSDIILCKGQKTRFQDNERGTN